MKITKRIVVLFLAFCLMLCGSAAAGDIAISAGARHTLILRDGALFACGENESGQFGKEAPKATSPIMVANDVKKAVAGDFFSLVLTGGGELYSYGALQLRSADKLGSFTPPQRIASGVSDFDAAGGHLAYIDQNGALFTAGFNAEGQLGDGSFLNSETPKKVMEDVAAVATGGNFTLALQRDGALFAFGGNGRGQLGLQESVLSQNIPTKIMENVAAFDAGETHSLILNASGELFVCGDNAFSQLGISDELTKAPLTKLMANVRAVSAGGYHSAAITTKNELYTFGYNSFGELGCGDFDDRDKPILVMGDVFSVSCGDYHTAVVKTGGEIFTFGRNDANQLGDGSYLDSAAPREIMSGGGNPPFIFPELWSGKVSTAAVYIDGKKTAFDAYNICDTTFFRLRDVAFALRESKKPFELLWDEKTSEISLIAGKPYTPIGGEMELGKLRDNAAAEITKHTVLFDGSLALLTAYIVDGSNFTRLREIGDLLDFKVSWDEQKSAIIIET